MIYYACEIMLAVVAVEAVEVLVAVREQATLALARGGKQRTPRSRSRVE